MQTSPIRGTAVAALPLPTDEYYRDEVVTAMGRARTTVKDPGAFESTTTSVPFGPGGPQNSGDGGVADSGGPAGEGGTALDGPRAADLGGSGQGGCGCTVGGVPAAAGTEGWKGGSLLLCGFLLRLRRRAKTGANG
jgi:hypothetical protein